MKADRWWCVNMILILMLWNLLLIMVYNWPTTNVLFWPVKDLCSNLRSLHRQKKNRLKCRQRHLCDTNCIVCSNNATAKKRVWCVASIACFTLFFSLIYLALAEWMCVREQVSENRFSTFPRNWCDVKRWGETQTETDKKFNSMEIRIFKLAFLHQKWKIKR